MTEPRCKHDTHCSGSRLMGRVHIGAGQHVWEECTDPMSVVIEATTDPRIATLASGADERRETPGVPDDPAELARRAALADVEKILKLHAPSESLAGEREDLGHQRCAYCASGRPLLRRFRDHLNGSAKKVWMHAHPMNEPWCVSCTSLTEYDANHDWPCPTYVSAARLRDWIGTP